MSEIDYTPTRRAGLQRLGKFQSNMGTKYSGDRNADHGPDNRDNVSCLSPWVRHRLLTEYELAEAALQRFSYSTAEKFIQEVCWRSYFKGWLEQPPDVWAQYCRDRNAWLEKVKQGTSLSRTYRSAVDGRTGIDCLDAWADELVRTGYLHNHARMWFASIWVFTLKLPWELGADFFLRHLMDGDPASNTLSWRWIAGLHTRGKTYLARRSNIEKYTDGRFSPEGLAGEAHPVEGFENPERRPLPQAGALPQTPFCLLLTEDDLRPETLLPRNAGLRGIIGATSPDWRSPERAGSVAKAFTQGAMKDGLERAAAHFEVEADSTGDETDLADILRQKCSDAGTDTIVTPWVPTGWVADRLAGAEAQLQADGVRIIYIRRDWDETFWPHATRGFFALKKKIPESFERLGLMAKP